MKQRLVGTLVLGSLALIVIPLLLDGEGVERPPLSGSIPPAPLFDSTPLPEPQRPAILADTQTPAAIVPEPGTGVVSDAATADAAVATEAPTTADAVTTTAQDSTAQDSTVQDSTVQDSTAQEASSEAASDITQNPATAPPVAEDLAAAAEPEPAAQSTSTPALDAGGLPEAWTVRLGSFGNRANADALVSRLVNAGHKAYIRPVVTGQGTLHGVFVGPLPTRNEAVALQGELKSRFQIADAIVQRFDIAQ